MQKLITWHLQGTTRKTIEARGAHVQDAFTGLPRGDRSDITVYCTHVTEKPAATFKATKKNGRPAIEDTATGRVYTGFASSISVRREVARLNGKG